MVVLFCGEQQFSTASWMVVRKPQIVVFTFLFVTKNYISSLGNVLFHLFDSLQLFLKSKSISPMYVLNSFFFFF